MRASYICRDARWRELGCDRCFRPDAAGAADDVGAGGQEIHARLQAVGLAEKTSFNLPFSQEVMSDVLGLSVPHLNRVMQKLRAEQLINTRSRLVELTDMTSLQTLAQYQPFGLAQIVAQTKRA